MKNLKITLIVIILTLCHTHICRAAFPVNSGSHEAISVGTALTKSERSAVLHNLKNMVAHGKAKMDQIVYIILAVFLLGWLAMGLNDNFQGNDWLISLILYILLVIPGIIYTIIKMPKYY